MSLITRLNLSVTAINRFVRAAPPAALDYFDLILTLDGDPISTLDNRLLAKQPAFLYTELTTIDGLTLVTLDGRILETREPV